MKQLSIEMPVVAECSITECAYNTRNCCHARAITVGDSVHPGCDTFLGLSGAVSHAREKQRTAGVGACKMSGCQHNDDYECMTDAIMVGSAGGQINCLTYKRR